eukprot:jgi/Tetstr1/432723/TSEL_022089.t1
MLQAARQRATTRARHKPVPTLQRWGRFTLRKHPADGMRVLRICDGMGLELHVLLQAGLPVAKHWTIEVNNVSTFVVWANISRLVGIPPELTGREAFETMDTWLPPGAFVASRGASRLFEQAADLPTHAAFPLRTDLQVVLGPRLHEDAARRGYTARRWTQIHTKLGRADALASAIEAPSMGPVYTVAQLLRAGEDVQLSHNSMHGPPEWANVEAKPMRHGMGVTLLDGELEHPNVHMLERMLGFPMGWNRWSAVPVRDAAGEAVRMRRREGGAVSRESLPHYDADRPERDWDEDTPEEEFWDSFGETETALSDEGALVSLTGRLVSVKPAMPLAPLLRRNLY